VLARLFFGSLLGALLLAPHAPAWARATGSGFFVTADGYFVTRYRLVADAEPLLIRDRDGATFPATLVAADPGNDLALLKADGAFSAIPLAPSGALAPGDPVFVARPGTGGDFSLAETSVAGPAGTGAAASALRISFPAAPGDAGAPLLSAGGDAVGVVAAGGTAPAEAGTLREPGGYATRSELLLALIEAEQTALAQLLPPGALRSGTGADPGALEPAVATVIAGPPDPPESDLPDQGEILVAEMYRIGHRARLEGDYPSAHRWLGEAALRGDARAQTALAGMYLRGEGVAPDAAQAARWYRSAAVRGDAEGRAGLGMLYAAGRGVAPNDDEALRWLREAAEAGNATGQNGLGLLYRDGRGVYRDDARAADWFRRAALQGDPAAQHNLGLMFRDGRGVEQDDAEAAWWLRRAAEQNHAGAQAGLALMYREGRGVPRDDAEAARWLRRAAAQGHAPGAYPQGASGGGAAAATGTGLPAGGE
jgi:hypothetical protein